MLLIHLILSPGSVEALLETFLAFIQKLCLLLFHFFPKINKRELDKIGGRKFFKN